MSFRWERKWIAAYVDGELGPVGRRLVRWRLSRSEASFEEYERLESISHLTRQLPEARAPKNLRTRIILATCGARRDGYWLRWKVRFQNLLQPLALPATGGVLAAFLLFGALISQLWISPKKWAEDVPLTYLAGSWASDPSVSVPSPLSVSEDITVEAFIDDQGRVYDFRLLRLPNTPYLSSDIKSQLANALLTTQFAPATSFGRPVRGRILISYVQVDVQG